MEKYVQQLEVYTNAIHERRPDTAIFGPDVNKTTAISQHWRQLSECESDKVRGRVPIFWIAMGSPARACVAPVQVRMLGRENSARVPRYEG